MEEASACDSLPTARGIIGGGEVTSPGLNVSRCLPNDSVDLDGQARGPALLCKEEALRIMGWNQHPPPVVLSTIPAEISRRAALSPHATAVEGPDAILTFAELEVATTRLSLFLRERSVGAGKTVLFCCAKEARSVVAIAAILRLGAIAVPLDPSHPASRNAAVAEAAEAVLALAAPIHLEALRQQLPQVPVMAIPECRVLSDKEDHPTAGGEGLPFPQPDDIAFVLFTSGSTGVPKGVLLDHCAICTSASTQSVAQKVSSTTRALQFSAFTFDVSVYDIWSTLIHGGCVCLVPEGECLNDLAKVITRQRITFVALTPALISNLSPRQVLSLETITIVGEGPTQDLVDTWAPELHLVNGYGSAEASTCGPAVMLPGTQANWIGRAVGACAWIVDPDDHQRLVPVGSVGELAVEGSVMARGYLKNEGATTAKFVEAPAWCPRPASRVYLTGDLVKYCAKNDDGSMVYVGRKDNMLKLYGRKIEAGEIEHHVRTKMPQPVLVAVEVVETAAATPRLVVFVSEATSTTTTNGDSQPDDGILKAMTSDLRKTFQQLRQRIRDSLPPFMVPSAYVPLTAMPVLTSRKIDRKYLARLGNSLKLEQLRAYSLGMAPQGGSPLETPEQLQLAALWAKILHTADGPTCLEDDFFVLGGDSVAAIRLAAEARRSGVMLSVEDMFLSPRLAEMAQALRPLSGDDGPKRSDGADSLERKTLLAEAAAACKVPADRVRDVFPATPFQEGLVAVSAQQPGSYIRHAVFELDEAVDVDRFVRAWEAAHAAFPILRTRILHTSQGASCAVVLDEPFELALFGDAQELPSLSGVGSHLPLVKFALSKRARLFAWISHHATHDAWSDALILDTVARIYWQPEDAALVLQTPPVSGKSFAEYCTAVSTQPETASFWKAQLCGSGDGPAQYPRPRQNVKTRPDKLLSHTIQVPRSGDSAAGAARVQGITAANLIKAAWALVLSCYSGNPNVIYGSVTTGRTAAVPDVDRVAGPTLATVPLLFRLDPDEAVSSFLRRTQADSARMMPFEQAGIQNIKKLCGDAGAGDFTTLLVVHPDRQDPLASFAGLMDGMLRVRDDTVGRANFHSNPITIDCFLLPDGADLRVSFDSALTSPFQMSHLLEVFQRVVNQFSAVASASSTTSACPPDLRLRDVDLLPDSHLTTLWAWNAEIPPPENSLLHAMVDAQARERPQSLAVLGPEGSYTFEELSKASTRLAQCLQRSEMVRRGAIVPLCFEKSALAPVVMLAVLKCGATFMSISHPAAETGEYPVQRVLAILESVKADSILCRGGPDEEFCRDVLGRKPLAADIVLQTGLQAQQPPGCGSFDTVDISPEDIAYIMTTSGSTGLPKCVRVSHRAICTSTIAQGRTMGIGPSTRAYQFSAYTFDTTIADIFTPLVNGGSVIVPTEAERLNELAGSIVRLNANFSFLTPTVLGLLEPSQAPCITSLVSTGEAINPSVIARWATAGIRLINSYGPAETAVFCAAGDVDPHTTNPNSIGWGMGSATWITSVEDPEILVPLGCVGEILVEGPIVASGYLNEPEKTADVFLPQTQWLADGIATGRRKRGSREYNIYRTGDLGIYNDDGSISYVGRKDSQVKINGQRVELGEIEYHMGNLVKDRPVSVGVVKRGASYKVAAFIVRDVEAAPDNQGQRQPPLFLPMTPAFAAEARGLANRLIGLIPAYMVPWAFVPLSYMPKTKPSLKKNRKALQEHAMTLPEAGFVQYCDLVEEIQEVAEPLTEEQYQLLGMWETVLKKTLAGSVGPQDSFFRLGGDSISAMKLSRIARTRGYRLEVRGILTNRELGQMATYMTRLKPAPPVQPALQPQPQGAPPQPKPAETSKPVPTRLVSQSPVADDELRTQAALQCKLPVDEIENAYACTPLQISMFAASLNNPEAYVNRSVFRCFQRNPPDIFVQRFIASWNMAIAAMPILRTRIIQQGTSGSFYQAVLAPSPIEVQRYFGSLENWLSEDSQILVTAGAPLARYALIQLPAQYGGKTGELYFVWVMHHCLYDGTTYEMMTTIVNEVLQCGLVSTKVTPFSRFVGHIQDLGESREESAEFWKNRLENCKATTIPRQRTSRVIGSTPSSYSQLRVSFETPWSRASSSIVLPSTVLSASTALVLSRYTDSGDVTFGMVRSGRDTDLEDIETILGPTIATVPARVRWKHDEPVSSFLQRVQQESAEAIPHQHFGLQSIGRIAGKDACAFDVLLVLQRSQGHELPDSSPQIHGFEQIPSPPTDFHTHPLNIECSIRGDQTHITVQYQSAILGHDEVQRLMWELEFVVRQLVGNASLPLTVGDIDLVSPQERSQIVAMMGPPVEPARNLVADLVHEQARRSPGSMALVGCEGTLTYAELDALSDQLSRHLVEVGAVCCPDKRQQLYVGLLFEKSMMYVVSLLAVLKTPGVAFVPLDATWPDGRLLGLAKQLGIMHVLVSENQNPRILALGDRGGPQPTVVSRSTLGKLSAPQRSSETKQISQERLPSPGVDDIAYVIFTSGSTGIPKGVVIQQEALATSLYNRSRAMNVSPHTRTLQYASYAFDASLDEILIPLVSGGSVAVPSPDQVQDDLAGAIREWGANFAFLTPTVAQLLLSPQAVKDHLETLVLLGEQMSDQIMDMWRGVVTLFNGYGPSECSIAATIQRHSQTSSSSGLHLEANNIGRPYGCRIWITDAANHNRLMPLGAVGQICIEGPILAQGYFGAESAAGSDSFVKNDSGFPFATQDVKRLYKTGDLGRLNADGSVTIVGRMGTQTKLRGQRLELGEIESRIKTSKKLPEDVTVVADVVGASGVRAKGGLNSTKSSEILALFVCSNSLDSKGKNMGLGQPPKLLKRSGRFPGSMELLQQYLKGVLPGYMVPTLFVPVSHIPMNLGGKRDRGALRRLVEEMTIRELAPYMLSQGQGSEQPKQPPTTGREAQLRWLWSRILGIAEHDIGLDDDWFKLGGNSISAVQLVSQARSEAEGLELSVRTIFRHPCLRDMAQAARVQAAQARLVPSQSMDGKSEVAPFSLLGPSTPSGNPPTGVDELKATAAKKCIGISAEMLQDILPCTPLQESMLAASLQKPGSYLNTFAYRVPVDIDLRRLQSACKALVDAQDILRTRIFMLNEKPAHAILSPHAPGVFSWTVLKGLDLQEVQALHGAPAAPEILGVPLCRFFEVHTPSREDETADVFFVWILHHACYDGRSMSLMLRQVEQVYNGHSLGVSPTTFPKYIFWLQRKATAAGSVADGDTSDARKFWRSYLDGPTTSRFPLLGSHEPEPESVLYRSLSWSRSGNGDSEGATDATLIQAAWALMLSTYCNSQDVCWGMTLSGREGDLDGLTDLVAPTLSTVPVRLKIRPDESIADFLSRVQQESGEMVEFGYMGAQNIAKLSADARRACHFNTRQVISLVQAEAGSNSSSKTLPRIRQEAAQDLLGMAPLPERDVGTEMVNYQDCALVLECTVDLSSQDKVLYNLGLGFDSTLVTHEEMEAMMDCLETVVRQLHEEAGSRMVGELEFVPPALRNLSAALNFDKCQIEAPDIIDWGSEMREIEQQHGIPATPRSFFVASPGNHKEPVPCGAVGVLCILLQQTQAMRGDSAVAELEKDSKVHLAAGPFFATGYLARTSGRNKLEILGRAENRRNLNGEVIVLEEADSAVARLLPGAKVAAEVIPLPSGVGEQTDKLQHELILVAFLAKLPGKDEDSSRAAALEAHGKMLLQSLPARVVPEAFVVVDEIPYSPDGRPDRRKLRELSSSLPQSKFLGLPGSDSETSIVAQSAAATTPEDSEGLLAEIWAEVLGIGRDRIRSSSTFMGLGGDSIAAMRLTARLRSEGIQLNISDILRRQSLASLAMMASKVEAVNPAVALQKQARNEQFEYESGAVPLSPMQKLFFRLSPQGCNHFNQSLLLDVPQTVEVSGLEEALGSVVAQHAALRARFQRSNSGEWCQEISPPSLIKTEYHLSVFRITGEGAELQQELSRAQRSLDIQHGPVFSSTLFEMSDGRRLLFLAAHHLIIDIVSWGILTDDLNTLLAGRSPIAVNSLPWRSWCSSQERLLSSTVPSGAEKSKAGVEFLDFWSMEGLSNNFADVASDEAVVSAELTSLFLGEANQALRTEPVELLAASLLVSFLDSFGESRREATVFLEGHGRDLLPDVDISQSVGWFTTIFPLSLSRLDTDSPTDSLVEGLRRVKDNRRKEGRASMLRVARSLAADSDNALQVPMEILLNYEGAATTNLGQRDGLLNVANDITLDHFTAGDVGFEMARMALIEISAVVKDGQLHLSMHRNRNMRHQEQITKWFNDCINLLKMQLPVLAGLKASLTLADVPLLPSLDYKNLSRLERVELPARGLSVADVEDMFPCSSVQQGILMSQKKGAGDYLIRVAWEVRGPASPEGIEQAWMAVVQRHGALRTIFLDIGESFAQVVLKEAKPKIHRAILAEEGDIDARKMLDLAAPAPDSDGGRLPPHCLSIFLQPWNGVEAERIFMVLSISHAITDGHSMDVLVRDMGLAYAKKLPPYPAPCYRDFISVHMQRKEDSLKYWRTYLKQTTHCIFPARRPGHTEQGTPQIRTKPRQTEAVLDFAGALHAFCKRCHVTVSDVAHIAWAVVLRLYTGCETPVFGYLFSGREGDLGLDVENTLGVFISMLVGRVALDSMNSLEDAVQSAHETSLQGLQHPHFSLAELQHELGVESFFNTGISVRRTVATETTASKSSRRTGPVSFSLQQSVDPTEYDMAISISVDADDSVSVSLAYWAEAVPQFQAEDALSLFVKAMRCISNNPSEPTHRLLGRLSRQELGADSWHELVPQRSCQSIARLFSVQAAAAALDAPAVRAWDGMLTYVDLQGACRKVSAYLWSRGVRPGDMVPVCFEKSSWYVVAVLGVLTAGAAFVPVDPSLPESGIDNILQSVPAKVAITSRSCRDKIAKHFSVGLMVLPDVLGLAEDNDSQPPPPAFAGLDVELDSPAYVVFTSGSTGKPKGVVVSHGALASSCAARRVPMGFGPNSHVLQFASSSFDVSIDEIILTLISGGCVCIPSDDARTDDLAGAIESLGVNTAMLTPSVARLILPGGSDVGTSASSSLQHLILGGEKISRDDIAAWTTLVPRLDIVYGPTECAIASTLLPCVTGPEAASCLGRPVGCAVWLVDPEDENKLVLDGCTGEMLIEGPILASEYLGDSDKTSTAFGGSPPAWAMADGKRHRRFFRTGDLAWRDGGCVLHFEGRKDNQIKLRGLRIEPENIEWNIKRVWPSSDCRAVVDLVPRPGPGEGDAIGDNNMLVAFVDTSSDSSSPTSRELCACQVTEDFRRAAASAREELLKRIPAYMIPIAFILVNFMPLSPSGKTDRRRLKELAKSISPPSLLCYWIQPGAAAIESEVETEAESRIKSQWAEVLGLQIEKSSLSRQSNFFHVGGDSMTALWLSGAARAEGYSLPVATVFKHPVLKDMAQAMTRLESSLGTVMSTEVRADGPLAIVSDQRYEGVFPATEFQAWCVSCSLADPRAYMAYFAVLLTGPLDMARLRVAIGEVVAYLPILRTAFLVGHKGREVNQAVLRSSSHTPNIEAVECTPKADLEVLAKELAAADLAKSPFRIGEPMSKFFVLTPENGGSRSCLVLRLSHAQYDGLSFRAMLDCLSDAYSGQTPLLPLPNFKQVASLSTRDSEGGRAAYEHWRSLLAGARPTRIISPAPSSSYPDTLASSQITLPAAFETAGFTTATVLNAAWSLVLAKLSASRDVLFGLVVSGREESGDAAAVGPTMNYVPVLTQLRPGWTARDLLAATQKQFVDGLAFHRGPVFEHHGRDAAAAGSGLSRRDVFSSVLQVQSAEVGEGTRASGLSFGGGVAVAPEGVRSVGDEAFLGCADVFVFAEQEPSGAGEDTAGAVKVTFSYSSAVVPGDLVDRMAGELESAVGLMARAATTQEPLPDVTALDPILPVA